MLPSSSKESVSSLLRQLRNRGWGVDIYLCSKIFEKLESILKTLATCVSLCFIYAGYLKGSLLISKDMGLQVLLYYFEHIQIFKILTYYQYICDIALPWTHLGHMTVLLHGHLSPRILLHIYRKLTIYRYELLVPFLIKKKSCIFSFGHT